MRWWEDEKEREKDRERNEKKKMSRGEANKRTSLKWGKGTTYMLGETDGREVNGGSRRARRRN